jgi:hypothetical protein
MKVPKKRPKYTAEQINEITARIAVLRLRWLCFVEAQLALRQKSMTTSPSSEKGEAGATV